MYRCSDHAGRGYFARRRLGAVLSTIPTSADRPPVARVRGAARPRSEVAALIRRGLAPVAPRPPEERADRRGMAAAQPAGARPALEERAVQVAPAARPTQRPTHADPPEARTEDRPAAAPDPQEQAPGLPAAVGDLPEPADHPGPADHPEAADRPGTVGRPGPVDHPEAAEAEVPRVPMLEVTVGAAPAEPREHRAKEVRRAHLRTPASRALPSSTHL